MKWNEAYEQVMRERDIAMHAKAIRDEAMRDLREKLDIERTKTILREMQDGRTNDRTRSY